jgi:hypothetical protein
VSRVPTSIVHPQPPKEHGWISAILRAWGSWREKLTDVINGGIGFGDGTSAEHIRGCWVTYTSNAVANTEDTVAHTLGSVPVGYLVFQQDKAASFYSGGTASVTVRIFVIAASSEY